VEQRVFNLKSIFMSYLKEANRIIIKKYSNYCSNCKWNGKEPISYTEFKQQFIERE
jgi:hypothetical protein